MARNLEDGARKVAGAVRTGLDKLEATQTPADNELVGKTAIVTAFVASGKTGEVRVRVRGSTEDFRAIPADLGETFAVNACVEIAAVLSARMVSVRATEPKPL